MRTRNWPHSQGYPGGVVRAAAWLVLIAVWVLALAGCRPGGTPAATQTTAPEAAPVEPSATLPPTNTPTPEATPTPSFTPTPTLLALGGEFGGITSTGDGFTGRGVLNVPVSNPTGETVEVVIPPGFVFLPPVNSGEQRLMVLQTETLSLGPGETLTVDPFVACIDADQSAPGEGTEYLPGGLVEDEELLEFAECLDQQELSGDITDIFGNMGLQFAIWEVSDGHSLQELIDLMEGTPSEEVEGLESGALGTFMSPELMGVMMPFLEQANASSQQYLQTCDIVPGAGNK